MMNQSSAPAGRHRDSIPEGARPAGRRTSFTVDVLALRHPLQWDISPVIG
jgi:hypothetical protein